MRWFTLLLVVLLLVSGCQSIEGFSAANPKTVMRFNPATGALEGSNNKDFSVKAEDLDFKGAGGTAFKAKKLEVNDNASDVRVANRQQMEGQAELARANGEMIRNIEEPAFEFLTEAIPYLPSAMAAKGLSKLRQKSITVPGLGTFSTGLSDSAISALQQTAGREISTKFTSGAASIVSILTALGGGALLMLIVKWLISRKTETTEVQPANPSSAPPA